MLLGCAKYLMIYDLVFMEVKICILVFWVVTHCTPSHMITILNLEIILYLQDGGFMLLRNVGNHLIRCTVS
jgi:hypothetical protein